MTGGNPYAVSLTAARSGDPVALHELVVQYTPLVRAAVARHKLAQPDAEDVVQTVWLALISHLDNFSEPQTLPRWLVDTVHLEALRNQRHSVRGNLRIDHVPADEALAQLPIEEGLPEEVALRQDRDQRLWMAFQLLPIRCQELLQATVLAERGDYQTVAKQLGMPIGSIGPTRGRCLARLRHLLEEQGEQRGVEQARALIRLPANPVYDTEGLNPALRPPSQNDQQYQANVAEQPIAAHTEASPTPPDIPERKLTKAGRSVLASFGLLPPRTKKPRDTTELMQVTMQDILTAFGDVVEELDHVMAVRAAATGEAEAGGAQ